MAQLTTEIIMAAIAGFEQQKRHMDEEIARLKGLLSGQRAGSSGTSAGAPTRKRRKLSADARRRMRDAQRARWARVRGETAGSPPAKQSAKPKRRLSEAGRQAIIAATNKRWRLQKANAKKTKSGGRATGKKPASTSGQGTGAAPA